MGFLGSVIKSGVKIGIVGGVIYAAHDQKLLSNAEEGEKIYGDFKKYVNENLDLPETKVIRDNIPDLSINPSKWNKGVASVFEGIRHSPESLSHYAVQGKDFIVSSLDALNSTETKSEKKE